MKIAFLIPTLEGGGAEKIAAELSFYLPSEWEKTFVLFDEKVVYPHQGKIISMGLPIGKNPFATVANFFLRFLVFSRIVAKEKFDVVLSFDDYANLLNIVCSKRAIISINKSLCMADRSKHFIKRFFSQLLRRIFYPKAHAVIAVSQGIKSELTEKFGVPASKVHVIYGFYDIKK